MYDLDDIAPLAELSTIPVITSEKGSLPWSRSNWVNQHFSILKNGSNKTDKEKL